MQDTVGETRIFSCGPLHTDMQVLADQQELTTALYRHRM